MATMERKNAVLADKFYVDNVLAAEDVAMTLPAVTFLTSEVQAMGTMDVVLAGIIEAMEMTISKVGLDNGLTRMMTPKKHNYEARWAQNTLKSDGSVAPEGCKAFITGIPKGIPGIGVELAANSENEIAIAVTRYQLYINGSEACCIDRIGGICRINGVDYYSRISSLL